MVLGVRSSSLNFTSTFSALSKSILRLLIYASIVLYSSQEQSPLLYVNPDPKYLIVTIGAVLNHLLTKENGCLWSLFNEIFFYLHNLESNYGCKGEVESGVNFKSLGFKTESRMHL